MKTIFLLIAILSAFGREVNAQTQSYVQVTSATFCGVIVASQTATRVDNFGGNSLCDGVLAGRNSVKVVNQTGNATINCGFSNRVSTSANSYSLGEEITAGAKVEYSLSNLPQLWCLSQSVTTGTLVNVSQAKPKVALGE